MRAADSRTFCTAGSKRPIRIAMIAMTTSNSISVNAERLRGQVGHIGTSRKNMRTTSEGTVVKNGWQQSRSHRNGSYPVVGGSIMPSVRSFSPEVYHELLTER